MRGGPISNDRRTREVGHIEPKRTILLMVEGESEAVYFNRVGRLSDRFSIRTKVSRDKVCTDIIKNCVKEADRLGLEDNDLKVAVFDLDVVDESLLEESLSLARENGVIVMTSNLSFEIWLLMHFEKGSRLYSQDDYERRLSELLGHDYAKAKGLGKNLNSDSIKDAIERGKDSLPDPDPQLCKARHNTSTLWSVMQQVLNDD